MARTDSLPEATGPYKYIRKLQYHEASRQWFAVLFVLLVSWLGQPTIDMLYAGLVFIVIGEAIRMWASGHVKKNKILATDGPYTYVRHPLYVGNILVVAGFSLASGLWWSPILMLALLFFYYPAAISYEDSKLKNHFGEQWEIWSSNTKALIPMFRNRTGTTSSQWSLKQSLMQNGEPVIVAYLIWCFYLLSTKLG